MEKEKSKESSKEKLKAKLKNKKAQRNNNAGPSNNNAGPSNNNASTQPSFADEGILQMMEHVNKILKTNPELVKQVSKCVSNVMNDKDILDKIKIIQDQTLDKSEETDDCLASSNELRQ